MHARLTIASLSFTPLGNDPPFRSACAPREDRHLDGAEPRTRWYPSLSLRDKTLLFRGISASFKLLILMFSRIGKDSGPKLALHWQKAENYEKAMSYFAKAAETTMQKYQHRDGSASFPLPFRFHCASFRYISLSLQLVAFRFIPNGHTLICYRSSLEPVSSHRSEASLPSLPSPLSRLIPCSAFPYLFS